MEPLKRNNFFNGRLLSAADLATEQNYFLARHRLCNRLLHGSGVVQGLRVSVNGEPGAQNVVIGPGCALDRQGNEICVGAEPAVPLPQKGHRLFALLCYRERLTDPVPALAESGDAGSTMQPTRIEEVFEVILTPSLPPKPASQCVEVSGELAGVPLARLLFSRGRWRVDRRFKVPRAR